MSASARVEYDYFAVGTNDSKIRQVGPGASPPGASRHESGNVSPGLRRKFDCAVSFRESPGGFVSKLAIQGILDGSR
jgi:hypothetical protein